MLGFFDEANRLEKLTKLGDSLVKLEKTVNWEIFRPHLEKALQRHNIGKRAGRPPYDVVLMFKILILQRLYNLSDEEMEFQINDRMSFMRFLGLGISDRVPDEKTIWAFREKLTQAKVIRELFVRFNEELEKANLISRAGTIVDATFVEAPRQRNSREENATIKEGNIPQEWEKDGNCNKLRQKDTEARWTTKRNELHYGYKNHVKADAESKLISDYRVTPANTHDSQVLAELVNDADRAVYADSAYDGGEIFKKLPPNVETRINRKACRHQKLTEAEKKENREKSKVRCRIEHLFGFMKNSMSGLAVRSIGLLRASFSVGLSNLIYNLFRYNYLTR